MWLFSKSESSSDNCSRVVTTGSQYLRSFAVHSESLAEDLGVTAQKILLLASEEVYITKSTEKYKHRMTRKPQWIKTKMNKQIYPTTP